MLNARLNRTPMTRAACLAIATAVIAVAVPIAALVASAQPASATFSGSLVDAVGRVLPATTIILVNAQSNEKHEALSDPAGHFAFTALPAGEYSLQARLLGFATSQGRLSLEAGQNLVRQVALQVAGIQETIHVSRPAPGTSAAPVQRSRAIRTPSESDDPCSQSAVGGCITPPTKIADVKPVYPPRQRDAGIGGQVELDARIGTDGFVKDFRVTTPADPDFVNAAIEAIRQWQFTATRLNGVPIEVSMHVAVSFVAE